MKLSAFLVPVFATLIAGCGSHTTAPKPTTASSHRGTPYRLYTHCGIEWATMYGTYWRARPALSDGSGNPPSGWGNPFQDGTLTRTGGSAAEFKSTAGSVTFRQTKRTRPPVICS